MAQAAFDPLLPPVDPGARWQTCGAWRFALIGLAAGLVLGTLGVGGGIVMLPLFTLWLGCDRIRSVAAALVVITGIGAVSVLAAEIREPENLHWPVSIAMAIGSFIGVTIGTRIATRVPDKVFALFFVALLLVGAGKQLGLFDGGERGTQLFSASLPLTPRVTLEYAEFFVLLVISGTIGGLGASILGIGGGVVYVTCMSLLHPTFADPHVARATSLGIVLATSVFATVLNVRRRRVPWRMVRYVYPFGVIGALGGVAVADLVDKPVLGAFLAVFLIFSALRMIAKQWGLRLPLGRKAREDA